MAEDNDWPAVVMYLSRSREVWKRVTRILSREGVEPRVSGFFFQAVVGLVLLFGSETLVVTPHMGRALGGFQYQVAQILEGWLPWQITDGKWEYTSWMMAREEAGF